MLCVVSALQIHVPRLKNIKQEIKFRLLENQQNQTNHLVL